jgi:hypothetical protein
MTLHPKVTAGALAGALTVIITAEAARRGYTIDGTEGASITVVLSLIAGYFVPADDMPAPPA